MKKQTPVTLDELRKLRFAITDLELRAMKNHQLELSSRLFKLGNYWNNEVIFASLDDVVCYGEVKKP